MATVKSKSRAFVGTAFALIGKGAYTPISTGITIGALFVRENR